MSKSLFNDKWKDINELAVSVPLDEIEALSPRQLREVITSVHILSILFEVESDRRWKNARS